MTKAVSAALLLAAIGLSLSAAGAQAQGVRSGPQGLRVSPHDQRHEVRAPVRRSKASEREARRLARAHGLSDIMRVFGSDEWVILCEEERRAQPSRRDR
jgi:hypothetical protein